MVAHSLEVGLDFERDSSWGSFPWLHYKEQSEVEEALLQAVGLRDFGAMETLLVRAAALGLNKKHSVIFFQAQELRDLLAHEKFEEAYLASKVQQMLGAPFHISSTESDGRPSALIIEARPASWNRGGETALPMSPAGASMLKRETSRGSEIGMHDVARVQQLKREDTQDRFAALLRALDVFMEDVITKVHDSAPLRPRFIDVLRAMRDSFSEFLQKSEDMRVTDSILELVSHSVGLEGVETEQCREQEQEKEQEQEQEQEVCLLYLLSSVFLSTVPRFFFGLVCLVLSSVPRFFVECASQEQEVCLLCLIVSGYTHQSNYSAEQKL